MPLLYPTDPLRRNDVLASNLLFATLLLSVLGELGMVALQVYDAHQDHLPVTVRVGRLLGLLAFSVLLRGGLYYGVRRGLLGAKLLLALGWVAWAYAHTRWAAGYVAEVDFAHLWGYPLLMLLRNLVTLATLVLMFLKPRPGRALAQAGAVRA